MHGILSVQAAGIHYTDNCVILGESQRRSIVSARALEVLSSVCRSSGYVPGQAVVVARAGATCLAARAAAGACVGRIGCRYMCSGKVRGSVAGSGADSRRPGC